MAESADASAGPPGRPVAPADRERVVEQLTRLYAEDRLSEDALEARLDRVYRAATVPELNAVVAGLTDAGDSPDARAPAPVPAGTGRAVTAAPQRIGALLSSREENLAGVVPARMEIRSSLAHIGLDLTGAKFEHGVTEIEVRALLGNVELRLPASVRLETGVRAILGDVSVSGGASAAEGAPVVRITGRVLLGAARCVVLAVDDETGRIGPGKEQ